MRLLSKNFLFWFRIVFSLELPIQQRTIKETQKYIHLLHENYLKNNKYDEGDIIFYRINYRLVDACDITIDEAEKFHSIYHYDNPRRVSQGYCHNCSKVVTTIPIIYGISEQDFVKTKMAQDEERLIIGSIDNIEEGIKVAMFGCKICKSPLPNYGTM